MPRRRTTRAKRDGRERSGGHHGRPPPGSTRKDPSVAFNSGMLRTKRCGAGAESQTWRHVVCVLPLPLVEDREKRSRGGPVYQFPTYGPLRTAGAHRGFFWSENGAIGGRCGQWRPIRWRRRGTGRRGRVRKRGWRRRGSAAANKTPRCTSKCAKINEPK